MTNEDSGGVADATLREFASGQKLFRGTLPNDPRVFMLTGFITRCQGEFEEGVRGLERALELDPRILRTLQQIALPYQSLRAMPRSAAMWDHALAIKPNDADTKVARAFLELDWKADTRPLIPQLWPIETATLLGPAPSRSASKKIVASLSPKETASK